MGHQIVGRFFQGLQEELFILQEVPVLPDRLKCKLTVLYTEGGPAGSCQASPHPGDLPTYSLALGGSGEHRAQVWSETGCGLSSRGHFSACDSVSLNLSFRLCADEVYEANKASSIESSTRDMLGNSCCHYYQRSSQMEWRRLSQLLPREPGREQRPQELCTKRSA